MTLIDDHLNEDAVIPTQRYYGISFLRDTSAEETEADKLMGVDKSNIKVNPIIGIKVKFFTQTIEQAREEATKAREIDSRFDIYVGEVGKWCPFNPSSNNCAENCEYAEKELNDIMKSYEQNQEKVKIYEEKRKVTSKIQNATENIKRKEKNRKKLLKEMEKSKVNNTDLIEKINEEIKKLEKEQKELRKFDKNYEKMIKEINTKQNLSYKPSIDLGDLDINVQVKNDITPSDHNSA